MGNKKVVYEDDSWTVEIIYDDEPHLRISCFEDCHYIEEVDITKSAMRDDLIDEFKVRLLDIKNKKGDF